MYHQKPLIGIKGRIQSGNYESEQGKQYYTEVVAEKVTFLSSPRKKEAE